MCVIISRRMAAPSAAIWTSDGNMDMKMNDVELVDGPKQTIFERRFSPYDFNGG